jgi:DNA-binding protein H-NS
MVDISLYSVDELDNLISDAREQLRKLGVAGRQKARENAVALILAEGFLPQDVFPELALKGASNPKYRHPRYHFLTWAGTGKPPAWFMDMLAMGWSKERLLLASQTNEPPPRATKRRAVSTSRPTAGLFSGLSAFRRQLRRQAKSASLKQGGHPEWG